MIYDKIDYYMNDYNFYSSLASAMHRSSVLPANLFIILVAMALIFTSVKTIIKTMNSLLNLPQEMTGGSMQKESLAHMSFWNQKEKKYLIQPLKKQADLPLITQKAEGRKK